MIALSILIAGYMIADAVLFVHGYKSSFWCAKTEQEKAVRKRWFRDREIEWDGKE